jgi:nitrogen fixation/metabolism regulation signal transduction histidine kinase
MSDAEDIRDFETKYKNAIKCRKQETEEFLKILNEIEQQFLAAENEAKSRRDLQSETVKESIKDNSSVAYALAALLIVVAALVFAVI